MFKRQVAPPPTPCNHSWFNVAPELKDAWRGKFQCGACGVWFHEERERVALDCERLNMHDAASVVRNALSPQVRK